MQAHELKSGDPLRSWHRQVLAGAAGAGTIVLLWMLLPLPALPAAIPVAFLAVTVAIVRPAAICLGFLTLTYFKLNEITPELAPLAYAVSAGSALTTVALAWHLLIQRSSGPRWDPLQTLCTLFWIALTASVVTAQDHDLAYQSWSDFSKILLLALGIAWFLRTEQHLTAVARLFMVGGVVVSLSCIYNGVQGTGLVEDTRAVAGTGGLSNPNDLALILLLPLSFAVTTVLRKGRGLHRSLAAIAGLIILTAIIYTQSRGGLLGVLAVFTVVSARFVKSKALLVAAALVLGAGLYGAMGISERTSGGVADEQGESAQGRLNAWQAGTRMAMHFPLTGVGIGNFADQFPTYTPEEMPHALTAHSIWFLVLGEAGLPGFVTFVVLIVVGFVRCVRTLRRLDDEAAPSSLRAIALATLAGLAGYCVGGSFLSYVYQWPLYVLLILSIVLSRLPLPARNRSWPSTGVQPAAPPVFRPSSGEPVLTATEQP